MCSLVQDLPTLSYIGFDVSYAALGPDAAAADQELAPQQALAQKVLDLVFSLMYARGSSMSWHTDYWPGLLGLVTSPDPADKQACVDELVKDWQAFTDCAAQKDSLFLKNLVRTSPFRTKPMAEVVDLLPAVGSTMSVADMEDLQRFAEVVWSGFGQSKVVEDANKEVRDKESRDTTNKHLKIAKQWNTLRSMRVLQSHQRQEPDPNPGGVGAPSEVEPFQESHYSVKGHPSVWMA